MSQPFESLEMKKSSMLDKSKRKFQAWILTGQYSVAKIHYEATTTATPSQRIVVFEATLWKQETITGYELKDYYISTL